MSESPKPIKKTKKKAAAPSAVIVTGYKGFDKNMQCRGKQYEVGKTYEEPETSLCGKGMHFCEDPWDVLSYYPLCEDNRYAEVTAENPSEERDRDSKRVTRKLEIGVEIGVSGWVKAAVSYLFKKVEWATGETASGHSSKLAASGHYSKLAIEGKNSIAVAVGPKSQAKGCIGAWIGLAEWDDDGSIIDAQFVKVDGEKIKADTYYILKGGQFVKAD